MSVFVHAQGLKTKSILLNSLKTIGLFYNSWNVQVKFRYCEKTTKFGKISHLFLKLLSNVKKSGKYFQIFMPSQNIWTLNVKTESRINQENKYFLIRNALGMAQGVPLGFFSIFLILIHNGDNLNMSKNLRFHREFLKIGYNE